MKNEILGIVRTVLAGWFGTLVAKGWITVDQSEQIITMLIGIGGICFVAIWSWISNSLHAVVAQAAGHPEVKEIVTTTELAEEIPDPKVVSEPTL